VRAFLFGPQDVYVGSLPAAATAFRPKIDQIGRLTGPRPTVISAMYLHQRDQSLTALSATHRQCSAAVVRAKNLLARNDF
jgi:hypothetical protein